jgi:hypothetical protein
MARKVSKKSYHQSTRNRAITPLGYSGLQDAYDHFNAELFGGELPDVFITYQRRAHSAGYFSADRFSGRVGKFGKHELALNPDGFVAATSRFARRWDTSNTTSGSRPVASLHRGVPQQGMGREDEEQWATAVFNRNGWR